MVASWLLVTGLQDLQEEGASFPIVSADVTRLSVTDLVESHRTIPKPITVNSTRKQNSPIDRFQALEARESYNQLYVKP